MHCVLTGRGAVLDHGEPGKDATLDVQEALDTLRGATRKDDLG